REDTAYWSVPRREYQVGVSRRGLPGGRFCRTGRGLRANEAPASRRRLEYCSKRKSVETIRGCRSGAEYDWDYRHCTAVRKHGVRRVCLSVYREWHWRHIFVRSPRI